MIHIAAFQSRYPLSLCNYVHMYLHSAYDTYYLSRGLPPIFKKYPHIIMR